MDKNKSFLDYLKMLEKECHIDKSIIYDGVSPRQLRFLSAVTLLKIAKNLNVDATCLYNQSLNLEALTNHFSASCDKAFIPSSYQKAAYSSTTSLRSVINEFKKFGKYEQILRMLQIHPEALGQHRPISVHVVQNVLLFMKNFISVSEIKGISKRNADSFLHDSEFGKKFHHYLHKCHAGEALFENVHLVERNWSYKIQKSRPGQVVIETCQSEEMLDFGDQDYTTNHMIDLRFNFFKRVFEHINNHCEVIQLTPKGKYGHFLFNVEYGQTKPLSFSAHLL